MLVCRLYLSQSCVSAMKVHFMLPGIKSADLPTVIPDLIDCEVVQLSAGSFHNIALQEGGLTWSWGLGQYGRLGHDDQLSAAVPTMIDSLKYVVVEKVTNGKGIFSSVCNILRTLVILYILPRTKKMMSWVGGVLLEPLKMYHKQSCILRPRL